MPDVVRGNYYFRRMRLRRVLKHLVILEIMLLNHAHGPTATVGEREPPACVRVWRILLILIFGLPRGPSKEHMRNPHFKGETFTANVSFYSYPRSPGLRVCWSAAEAPGVECLGFKFSGRRKATLIETRPASQPLGCAADGLERRLQ